MPSGASCAGRDGTGRRSQPDRDEPKGRSATLAAPGRKRQLKLFRREGQRHDTLPLSQSSGCAGASGCPGNHVCRRSPWQRVGLARPSPVSVSRRVRVSRCVSPGVPSCHPPPPAPPCLPARREGLRPVGPGGAACAAGRSRPVPARPAGRAEGGGPQGPVRSGGREAALAGRCCPAGTPALGPGRGPCQGQGRP